MHLQLIVSFYINYKVIFHQYLQTELPNYRRKQNISHFKFIQYTYCDNSQRSNHCWTKSAFQSVAGPLLSVIREVSLFNSNDFAAFKINENEENLSK
jgi:hypothetical protein